LEFPLLLILIGEPEGGTMLLSYLGLLLLGGAFLSVGLFCSSLTRNQMVAAILTFVVLITLWFLSDSGGPIGETISVITHLDSFGTGVFDLSDFLYYLLFIFGFLFLTVRWMEAERWK
ncbi:MAG: hypothetical protein HYW02_06225, partial [Deltaproteobacteria bacterium]|nr:hypothetical protein [Deltaproteobacteria bacterium]